MWADSVVGLTTAALRDAGNAERAAGAFAYMKGVAPFLGVATPDRRRLLKQAWKALPLPTSSELGEAALALTKLHEREYHYAAYDLIAMFNRQADERFLELFGEDLLLAPVKMAGNTVVSDNRFYICCIGNIRSGCCGTSS